MDEKQKMLSGLIYDGNYDEALKQERILCKTLCHKYNNLAPDNVEERKSLLQKLLGSVKENFWIEPPFWCDYGYNIEVGENFYSNHNLVILDPNKVTFGDNVFIGPNCSFYTPQHPLDAETRNKGLEYAFPIKIGNNVWLGGNVTVLPNVTIGDNVVIGAGSVVTKSIPANVIAAGNPCRVIREITEKDKYKFEERI
ncbi:MAG: sugar O-acetyltransferase [Fusobacterium sp.]|nr:sugar O-acetyltransferase [Fusobacterium sp.]